MTSRGGDKSVPLGFSQKLEGIIGINAAFMNTCGSTRVLMGIIAC